MLIRCCTFYLRKIFLHLYAVFTPFTTLHDLSFQLAFRVDHDFGGSCRSLSQLHMSACRHLRSHVLHVCNQIPCVHCGEPVVEGEFLISTYQPAAVDPLPANAPLHAKECAHALFDDNIEQFVDNMTLEGLPSDKVVTADSLDFEF